MSIIPSPRQFETDGPKQTASHGEEEHRDLATTDDRFLIQAIAGGDAEALEELIARYWAPLTSYACRILDDMEAAEDIVQQTFIAIWTDRAGAAPRSVRAYLYRSVHNGSIDAIRSLRARRKRERISSDEDTRHARTPDVILAESILAGTVNSAIQCLPSRRRQAFVLAYLKNMSYDEVAMVMDISTKTVGHHVSAALSELRHTLSHIIRQEEAPVFDESVRPLYGDRSASPPRPGPS